jgi:hypothetical protein
MKRVRYHRPSHFSALVCRISFALPLSLLWFWATIDRRRSSIFAWTFLSVEQKKCQSSCFGGVTSLHWWKCMGDDDDDDDDACGVLIAGTKTGGIYCGYDTQDPTSAYPSLEWMRLNTHGIYETKYPIYSLITSSKHLFCGDGNRRITVWKGNKLTATKRHSSNWQQYQKQQQQQQQQQQQRFHYIQELGPHTGWVKDVVYDDHNSLLHSIGCNCIETWDCSVFPFQHQAKRSIENSPAMGSTLSSDLLCLCLIQDSEYDSTRILVSGGVDGRIHLWRSDPYRCSKQLPLCSVRVHDGRVNKVVYSKALNVILSVGSDGKLSACRVHSGWEATAALSQIPFVRSGCPLLNLDLRLTTMILVEDDAYAKQCHVALGSSNGQVRLASINALDNDKLFYGKDQNMVQLTDEPLIYALACETFTTLPDKRRLWVGHATGLVSINIIKN